MKEIIVDGVTYVPKQNSTTGYSMVRTYSAGVFYGKVESLTGKHAVVKDARRVYSWSGASTLSELATEGTAKPDGCKFPCAVDEVILTEVIEVIPMTEKAKKSLDGVKVWTQFK